MYKIWQKNSTYIYCIERLSDHAMIPLDSNNTDYQAFLKYKEEGGKVYGPDEEVPTGE
jgi:hypothetical protein